MSALTAVTNPATALAPPAARDDLRTPADRSATLTGITGAPSPRVDDSLTGGDETTFTEKAELTIDGLLEAWGTDDPRYDINGDGTVNIDDLFSLLDQMAQELRQGDLPDTQPPPPAPPPEVPAPEAPETPAPLGPNGDVATPPATDTLTNTPPDGEVTTSVGDSVLAEGNGEVPQSQDNPLTIDDLLNAWGTDNPHYDLNGDGMVDVDDLFALLAKMAEKDPQGTEPPVPMGPSLFDSRVAAADSTPRALADTLIDKLTQVGFEERPPSNIRSLIDLMDLGPRYEAQVMKQLSEFYAQGLGIDHRG